MILGLPGRFWSRAVIDDAGHSTPCLTWTGSKTNEGYGRISWRGKMRFAHRVAYETQIGPVPEGLELDHLCHNTSCVNTEHLEAVTHAENMQRRIRVGANETHCSKGHPYTDDNLIVRPCGRRRCRACDTARSRDYYRRVIAPRRAKGDVR